LPKLTKKTQGKPRIEKRIKALNRNFYLYNQFINLD